MNKIDYLLMNLYCKEIFGMICIDLCVRINFMYDF